MEPCQPSQQRAIAPSAPPGRYLWRRHLLSCHLASSWELKLGLGSRTRPAHLPPDSPSVAPLTPRPTLPTSSSSTTPPPRRVFPLLFLCRSAAPLCSTPRRTGNARHSARYLFCRSALFPLLSSMRRDNVVCGGQLSPHWGFARDVCLIVPRNSPKKKRQTEILQPAEAREKFHQQ